MNINITQIKQINQWAPFWRYFCLSSDAVWAIFLPLKPPKARPIWKLVVWNIHITCDLHICNTPSNSFLKSVSLLKHEERTSKGVNLKGNALTFTHFECFNLFAPFELNYWNNSGYKPDYFIMQVLEISLVSVSREGWCNGLVPFKPSKALTACILWLELRWE